jgi:hypothetical protein
MEISVFEESIQDLPGICEKRQKSSRESPQKSRIYTNRSRLAPHDFVPDSAPTTDKMSSFNIFPFQSSDLPESGEESQKRF